MKKASRTAFLLGATLSRRMIIDGRTVNATSVRPLTMATKFAQEVCLWVFNSGFGGGDGMSLRDQNKHC